MEKDIQDGATKKDSKFILDGSWKKFHNDVDEFKVYSVDGDWVRHNLSVIFGHGGHGYVHEFIPLNEIWIASHHPKDCACKNVSKDRKVSNEYFESCTIHEITERKEMEKGAPYHKAHTDSNKAEIDAGLLKMPDVEVEK